MPGSKEQCSVEVLQKILKKNYPDYIVVGNQPYHTATLLLKREGSNFLLVKSYEKNNDLFREMIRPGWYPGKVWETENSLFQNLSTKPEEYVNYNRYLLQKLSDLLKSAEDIGKHFGINVETPLLETRKMYLKIIANAGLLAVTETSK